MTTHQQAEEDGERQPLLRNVGNNAEPVEEMELTEFVEHVPVPRVVVLFCSTAIASLGAAIMIGPFLLPVLRERFKEDTQLLIMTATLMTLGGLFGTLIGALLSDGFGRLLALRVWGIGLAVISLLQCSAPGLRAILVMRTALGVCFGGMMNVVGPYLSEFLPTKNRGLWLTGASTCWSVGTIWAMSMSTLAGNNWRLAYGLNAVPSLVVAALLMMPRLITESPRWLLLHGREQEALVIFDRLCASLPGGRPAICSRVIIAHDKHDDNDQHEDHPDSEGQRPSIGMFTAAGLMRWRAHARKRLAVLADGSVVEFSGKQDDRKKLERRNTMIITTKNKELHEEGKLMPRIREPLMRLGTLFQWPYRMTTLTILCMYGAIAGADYSLGLWRPVLVNSATKNDEAAFYANLTIDILQVVVQVILAFTIDMTGRRSVARFGFLLGLACCIVIVLWGPQEFQLLVVLCIVLSFNQVVWTAVGNTSIEAYPTTVRGSAGALCLVSVRICAFVCPTFVVPPLGKDGSGKSATLSVIAVIFVIGLVGAILLPVETAGRPMADVAPMKEVDNKPDENNKNHQEEQKKAEA